MLTLCAALVCGLVGTFAAGFAYVRSNQFVLGEDTRPERHRQDFQLRVRVQPARGR
ncbi:MAG: hypothetical protein U1F60_11660 [Planctomycetota bacterium]